MKVNPYVFRAYDIRGEVEKDFPPEFVQALGRGYGTFVKRQGGKEIALSGDIRLTTPRLKENFKSGLLATGVDVIDIGILPTPANYYSMFSLNVSGSVQITGSHNPPEFNGFKMSFQKGAVYGDMIQEIRSIIEKDDFETGNGSETKYDILNDYMNLLQSKVKLEKNLKVALDCGNAAGALVAPQLFKNLGVELTELFCEVDGNFPNHHPDPTVPENLEDIIQKIKSDNYDVGIAFDGDADRIGVIDDHGEIIWADMLMALFLPEIIDGNDDILFDVKCSQALEDEIIRLGGNPVIWKTGHSLIKQRMKELSCKFGGEMSGHLFFADDYFGYDDAIYVAIRLLQMLSRTDSKLSELARSLPVYYSTPELRLDCLNDEEKFKISKRAVEYFSKEFQCLDIDGVRIKFDDGWGLIRASNTQPVIVCRFEAQSEDRKNEIMEFVFSKLRDMGEISIPENV